LARKAKGPGSLRSHGLNGDGAALYLSGYGSALFFVGAAFSRENLADDGCDYAFLRAFVCISTRERGNEAKKAMGR